MSFDIFIDGRNRIVAAVYLFCAGVLVDGKSTIWFKKKH